MLYKYVDHGIYNKGKTNTSKYKTFYLKVTARLKTKEKRERKRTKTWRKR